MTTTNSRTTGLVVPIQGKAADPLDEFVVGSGFGADDEGHVCHPVALPEKFTQLCQTMWDIGGVVAKTAGGWPLVEVWIYRPQALLMFRKPALTSDHTLKKLPGSEVHFFPAFFPHNAGMPLFPADYCGQSSAIIGH